MYPQWDLLTSDYSKKLTTVNTKKQGPKGETGDLVCARVTGKPEVNYCNQGQHDRTPVTTKHEKRLYANHLFAISYGSFQGSLAQIFITRFAHGQVTDADNVPFRR
jgi:hypothetical protein